MYRTLLLTIALFLNTMLFAQPFNLHQRAALLNLMGYNVCNAKGLDNRLFQKFKIENMQHSPGVIVLGSSRVRSLNDELLKRKNLVNNGLSGGSVEDLIAVYCLYRNKNFKPKELYIGIDTWYFYKAKYFSTELWKSLEPEYNQLFKSISSQRKFTPEQDKTKKKNKLGFDDIYPVEQFKFKPEDFSRKFSADSLFRLLAPYFEKEAQSRKNNFAFLNDLLENPNLYDALRKNKRFRAGSDLECMAEETSAYRNTEFAKLQAYQKFNILKLNRMLLESLYGIVAKVSDTEFPTLNEFNKEFTYLKNGATTFAYAHEHRTEAEATNLAKNFLLKIKGETTDKEVNSELFELFINYVSSENIKLNFIIVPYHPLVYNSTEKAFFVKCENYIQTLAKAKNIKVYGSFNPTTLGMDESDFYDESHVRHKSLSKLKFE